MRRKIAFLILLFSANISVAQTKVSLTKKPNHFDEFVSNLMKEHKVPGVTLLITQNGKILQSSAYGYANLEDNVPAKLITKYELASISKLFTATAIMILAEQKKLYIDSTITNYLDNVPQTHKDITIRNLLNHTSGIPSDHWSYMKLYAPSMLRYSVKDQLADLYKMSLQSRPGAKYSYSNAGYFLLAAIIEKLSGQSYQQFIKSNIFDKAGMRDSYFINADSILLNRAQGYTLRQERLVHFSLTQAGQSIDANGFAGIISTAEDLTKWLAALYSDKIIKKETLEQMTTPSLLTDGTLAGPKDDSTRKIGLGWHIKYAEDKKFISHTGASGTALVYFPDQKLTIIFLSNLESGYPNIDNGLDPHIPAYGLAAMVAKEYLK
jgi:CubicO group peptidase (beta-lactamase class C family)